MTKPRKFGTFSIGSRVSTKGQSQSISQSDVTEANVTNLQESGVVEENGTRNGEEELEKEPCVVAEENGTGISLEKLDEEPCTVTEENETEIS
jgi:hypothetical protein